MLAPVVSALVRIVYTQADEPGWFPITHMVELLAHLTGSELVRVPFAHRHTLAERLSTTLPRVRRGTEDLLIVCPQPGHLQALTHAGRWWSGYRSVAGWVVDSWWDEWIPQLARARSSFDLLCISEAENIDTWRSVTSTEVLHLPMGADVLGNGVDTVSDRPHDLLRVGRMPPAWDDDDRTDAACREVGLTFHGRPPMHRTSDEGMRGLWSLEGQAKLVLAFSNLASPASYTHPTLEYFTPRWADAISCGATTVGRLPRTATTALLSDHVFHDVPADDLDRGVHMLAKILQDWTPEVAAANRREALRAIDWRHRFQTLADHFDLEWPLLTEALVHVDAEAARLAAGR